MQSKDKQESNYFRNQDVFAEIFDTFSQQVRLYFLVNFSVLSQLKELFCRPVNIAVDLVIHC